MTKRFWLVALGILVAGLTLRVWNLNRLPIFADESIYVRWSQVMRAESSLRFLPLSDGKQPFFMWATIPMFKLIADPLVAARTLSALADTGSILLVGVLAYLMFKNYRLSLVAATIYAVIPYSVFFGRMALVDSMLAFFVLLSTTLAYYAVQSERLDIAMFAGFAFGFAWLTKFPAIFTLGMWAMLWLLVKPSRRNLINLLVAAAIGTGMYNILRLGDQFPQLAARNKDYVLPFSEVLKHPFDPLKPHALAAVRFFGYYLTPLGLLFAIWGLVAGGKSHLQNRLILGLFVVGVVGFESAIARGFTARYLLFTVPFAVILTAHGIEHLIMHTQKHYLLIPAVLTIVLPSLWWQYTYQTNFISLPMPVEERAGYLEEWTAGFGIREAAQKIVELSGGKNVVVGSEGYFGTPFDGLGLYLNPYPQIRVIGVGVWIDSADPKLVSAAADNQVYLVVNASRFHTDTPEKFGLHLLADYPKVQMASGETDKLLLFAYHK